MVGFEGFVGWWLWMDGREQKVGFAEKKTAPIACRIVSCVSRVVCPYLWWLATTNPLRLSEGHNANPVESLKLDKIMKGIKISA